MLQVRLTPDLICLQHIRMLGHLLVSEAMDPLEIVSDTAFCYQTLKYLYFFTVLPQWQHKEQRERLQLGMGCVPLTHTQSQTQPAMALANTSTQGCHVQGE